MISIIIPSLNEAPSIAVTLDAVSQLLGDYEVLVVDGGSNDNTREIAVAKGVKVIGAKGGRGRQMHEGARAALGETLWFLHADTIVPPDAITGINDALGNPEVVAGNFEIRFAGPGWPARFMTWLYPQLRRLGLCYGDSAIFVKREAYDRAGGVKPFPVFEDLDLVRKLRRVGRFVHLRSTVVTSSRRFQHGFLITFTRWTILQVLYWLGVNPDKLGRFYARRRVKSFKKSF